MIVRRTNVLVFLRLENYKIILGSRGSGHEGPRKSEKSGKSRKSRKRWKIHVTSQSGDLLEDDEKNDLSEQLLALRRKSLAMAASGGSGA